MFTRESLQVLTMLVTKICTNASLSLFFSTLSTYLFSIMYMSEKNVKSETVRFPGEQFFPYAFFPADSGDGRWEAILKLEFLRV